MNRKIITAAVAIALITSVGGVSYAQHVKVFDGASVAPASSGFRGGVNVAAGDVNGAAAPAAPGGIAAPGQEPTGLLLPAVQKAREAASRSQSQNNTPPAAPSANLSSGQDPQAIGLLVPAIQKAREAAR